MKKTITITDPMQVKAGDKAYFKDCDFGFTVIEVDNEDPDLPFSVMVPYTDFGGWAWSSHFDHAEHTVEEPEWPDPHDIKLHIYLGSDGGRYIYNPCNERDTVSWVSECHFSYHTREIMKARHRDALPLTELRLVPMEAE